MNRSQYDESLQSLRNIVLHMGEKVEVAIDQSIQALKALNRAQAERVIARDADINEMEEQIAGLVTMLIATQQPVAKDLRQIVSALSIASDMERMGDLAQNIAQVAVRFVDNELALFKPLEDIPHMARLVQDMVHDGINSFIDGNVSLAEQLRGKDDAIDRLNISVFYELIDYMVKDSTLIEPATQLAFVSSYLERIADHATNIGESVIYIETGKRVDLN